MGFQITDQITGASRPVMIWIVAFFIMWLFGIQDRKNQHVKVNRIIGLSRYLYWKYKGGRGIEPWRNCLYGNGQTAWKLHPYSRCDVLCISQWLS